MRTALLEFCLVVTAIVCIHTVRIMRSSTIKGKVYPANVAESIVAINGSDSVKAISKNGYFGMKVKPGIWKVIVGMNTPVKNVVRERLEVTEGENINLGEIRLAE